MKFYVFIDGLLIHCSLYKILLAIKIENPALCLYCP